MSDHTKALKAILSDGTIAFHAIFSKAFRSLPIGVFLSQGFFWQENAKFRTEKTHRVIGGKLFFTKTAKEWFEETSLSPDQQKAVRVTLCKQGVLIEKLTDNPAKLYFHIDFETLVSEINRYLGSGVSVLEDKRNLNRFKSEPSIGNNPRQDSDKILTYYNEESLDSFEREGERTPPAPESQNLKEEKEIDDFIAEKNESPKVALKGSLKSCPISCSPSDYRAGGKCDLNGCFFPTVGNYEPSAFDIYGVQPLEIMEGETFDEIEARLRKQTSGAFQVTAIASPTDIPGVTLVEAVKTRAENTLEAEQMITGWIEGEGEQTVKHRYNTAKQRFDPANAAAIAAHYCSVYTKTAANKGRLLSDPITHFSDGLFSYLKNEETFGRNNAPGNQAQVRVNGQPTQNLTSKMRQL